MTEQQEITRAPGYATSDGTPTCKCVEWAQPLGTPNAKAFLKGLSELEHAPLCDGAGNPTRGLGEDSP